MSAPKRLLEAVTLPPEATISREAAQAICEKIVKMSKADAINVINTGRKA